MTAQPAPPTIGVVLMSFGAAATLDDIPAYLSSVRGGRPVPDELVAEFRRRYDSIGGSPLTRITQEQAAALEALLQEEGEDGRRYRVLVGMRHAPPFIADAFSELASEGVKRVLAVIMAPQHSPIIMRGYHSAVEQATPFLGADAAVRVAGAWHDIPAFQEALATRVKEALERFPQDVRDSVPVLFTTHSLPKSVVDREPEYLTMLWETKSAVAESAGLASDRCHFVYQSAGHTAEEWLKPDIADLFPDLAQAGHRDVLIVPVQFLADHLEVLYDIDVAARTKAEEAGICLTRTESFNASLDFIRALGDLVHRETAA